MLLLVLYRYFGVISPKLISFFYIFLPLFVIVSVRNHMPYAKILLEVFFN